MMLHEKHTFVSNLKPCAQLSITEKNQCFRISPFGVMPKLYSSGGKTRRMEGTMFKSLANDLLPLPFEQ